MNAIIKDEEYRKNIAKAPGRAFLFFGEEDYLKAAAVRETRAHLCPDPAMAFFNDVTIDFTDYTPDIFGLTVSLCRKVAKIKMKRMSF